MGGFPVAVDGAPRPAPASATRMPSQALAALRDSGPVGLGLVPLGIAFGVFVTHSGLAWWWASVFTTVIYAGSFEFLLVGLVTAGALLGSLIPDRVTGLDFALTALFTVLALDALRGRRDDLPTPALAVLSALAARLVFPGEMLLVAFALFTVGLLARHLVTSKRASRA